MGQVIDFTTYKKRRLAEKNIRDLTELILAESSNTVANMKKRIYEWVNSDEASNKTQKIKKPRRA